MLVGDVGRFKIRKPHRPCIRFLIRTCCLYTEAPTVYIWERLTSTLSLGRSGLVASLPGPVGLLQPAFQLIPPPFGFI